MIFEKNHFRIFFIHLPASVCTSIINSMLTHEPFLGAEIFQNQELKILKSFQKVFQASELLFGKCRKSK